jgi:peroxiredoxin
MPALPLSSVAEELPSPYAVEKVVMGQKAPEFTLKDMEGRPVSLSSYRGRAILLVFWASWCPTAGEQFASLNRLNALYKDRGLAVISVSTDKSLSAAKGFLAGHQASFGTLHDGKLYVSKTLYKAFMIPMAFLIDRGGVVVKKRFGQQDWTEPEIIADIDALLARRP